MSLPHCRQSDGGSGGDIDLWMIADVPGVFRGQVNPAKSAVKDLAIRFANAFAFGDQDHVPELGDLETHNHRLLNPNGSICDDAEFQPAPVQLAQRRQDFGETSAEGMITAPKVRRRRHREGTRQCELLNDLPIHRGLIALPVIVQVEDPGNLHIPRDIGERRCKSKMLVD